MRGFSGFRCLGRGSGCGLNRSGRSETGGESARTHRLYMRLIMGKVLTGGTGILPGRTGSGSGRLIGGTHIVTRSIRIMPGSLIFGFRLGSLFSNGIGIGGSFRITRQYRQKLFNNTSLIDTGAENH